MITGQTTSNTYQGDGSNRVWNISFEFIDSSQIKLKVNGIGITDNFSVDPVAKTVTYPTIESELEPLNSSQEITIYRETPVTQEIDFTNGGPLNAEMIENGLDKLTQILQEGVNVKVANFDIVTEVNENSTDDEVVGAHTVYELTQDAQNKIFNLKYKTVNEFIITEEIFNKYKNSNNYANLANIISNETITQSVINLNNYNFFLSGLTVSNKTLIFKNGNIVLDSNGIDGTCDKAITASGCNIKFKDCQISSINCVGNTNALIDINNTNLTFDNVIADDINFSSTKTFIQTTNACKVKINESDIEIINTEEPIGDDDEPQNIITFIKVLSDNSKIDINNSIIKIDKASNQLRYFKHKIVSTATNTDVAIKVNGSYVEIEDNWQLPHTHKEYELSNIFDVNLDNINIDIINSCINNQSVLRLETKYLFEQGKTYTTEDPYCINIYNNIEASENSESEPIFEEINVDEDTFVSVVDYKSGEYIFVYNGASWLLDDEEITLSNYGITYTLAEGAELTEGVEIQIYYNKGYQAYTILEDFTAVSSDIGDYTSYLEERDLSINKCYNSVLAQSTEEGNQFLNYFINLDIESNTGVFSAMKIQTNNLYIPKGDNSDYFLPIEDDNLEADNVRDAIIELANRVKELEN